MRIKKRDIKSNGHDATESY